MNKHHHLPALAISGLALALLLGPAAGQQESSLTDFVAPEDPPAFDLPADAADALKKTLVAGDFEGTARLLGLDPGKLKASEGTMDTFTQMTEGAAKKFIVADKGDEQIVRLGDQLWPLPFPITKGDDGKWAFDTYAGIEEVINRRVGENESEAVATARQYVEAQADYLAEDHDSDGVLEYAQKLISTPGTMDGLYWPADEGDAESPAGSFADETQRENVQEDRGYFGYRFRVLTGQGDNIAGGAHDYVINDNMIVGFALVAWPVTYAETGVNTYVVSKEGVVYQADLGGDTEKAARAMEQFNPDDNWKIATD